MLDKIKAELVKSIDAKIIDTLFEHYRVIKYAFVFQDWEKCLLRGGKFAEETMKGVCFLRTGTVVEKISIDQEISEVAKRGDLSESVRILIPRAVRLIYDHRNKRGGAHSCFDPNQMDAALVVSLVDWIVSELIRTFFTVEPELAMKISYSITTKSLPIVEKIDGDYIALVKSTSARREIALILYSRYPERTKKAQLNKWLKNYSASNISQTIGNMGGAKLLHTNEDGIILTTLGIQSAEKEIASLNSIPKA